MFKERKSAIVTYLIALFVAAILPLIIFAKEFSQIRHDSLFIAIWGVLLALAVILSIRGIIKADDPAFSKGQMYIPVLIATVLALWSFGWLAEYRSKTEQGIEYKYNK